jgi:hypothetical protein
MHRRINGLALIISGSLIHVALPLLRVISEIFRGRFGKVAAVFQPCASFNLFKNQIPHRALL